MIDLKLKEHEINKFKKVKPDMDSLIESDEHFGFIAGYTSNGVPYGLTHEEWSEINSETKNEKTDELNGTYVEFIPDIAIFKKGMKYLILLFMHNLR